MPGLKPGFGRLATLAEALDVLSAHRPVMGTEGVLLEEALHRVLSKDVVSEIDVPHFAKAAMDGYAVIAEDTFGAGDDAPKTLEILGALSPGSVWPGVVTNAACLEIGTGSVIPAGADAVVMVEYTEPELPTKIRVRKGVAPGDNVIKPASDIRRGDVVLRSGALIGPTQLGALAAIGAASVQVAAKPTVALFSTGPELVEPGNSLGPGQIYDINTYTLRAAVQADGFLIADSGSIPDQAEPLRAAVERGLGAADVVVVSGGSSLGGSDLVVEVFESIGEVLIHGVAVKPGKPLVVALAEAAAGTRARKLMIGLPGYPVSALSDYYVFVQPCLRAAAGMTSQENFTDATLARKHASVLGRYEFVPVRVEGDRAHPLNKGSSSITALAHAHGFIEIHENVEVLEEGEPVRVRRF